MSTTTRLIYVSRFAALFSALVVAACGGGGGAGAPSAPPAPAAAPSPAPAALSDALAQRCAPDNFLAPLPHTGTLEIEKRWLRAYLDEAYIWYDEIRTVDATEPIYNTSYPAYSLNRYFDALLPRARDRFSAVYPTQDLQQLLGSGVQPGYGIEWLDDTAASPRSIRVAYVHPGSQADQSGVRRGDSLVTVDGISDTTPASDPMNGLIQVALFPAQPDELHQFVFERNGVIALDVALQSGRMTMTPVPTTRTVIAPNGARVGYIVFHDHIAPAESQLVAAIEQLRADNVTELVLDIRYNGGGYLYLASQLAYMIAGPTHTAGKTFERYVYNDKRAAETADPARRIGFIDTRCELDAGLNCTSSALLPTLGLSRVHVLTRSSTCSASEAIINGLRGADVEVRQFGSATCGKPYGSVPRDNCGISYLPVEFKAANGKGFGDYIDGFSPANASTGSGATRLPGCLAEDDLSQPLGNPGESLLASALSFMSSGTCPAQGSGFSRPQNVKAGAKPPVLMHRNPVRENRIVLPG